MGPIRWAARSISIRSRTPSSMVFLRLYQGRTAKAGASYPAMLRLHGFRQPPAEKSEFPLGIGLRVNRSSRVTAILATTCSPALRRPSPFSSRNTDPLIRPAADPGAPPKMPVRRPAHGLSVVYLHALMLVLRSIANTKGWRFPTCPPARHFPVNSAENNINSFFLDFLNVCRGLHRRRVQVHAR